MQGGGDMRGSSAIQGAVRSQRMVNVMPAQEAARLQIPETDRRRYIRITNEKVNYAPSGRGSWFRLASVELPNGDSVGVVEPWRHPDEGGEITPEMVAAPARAEEVFLTILARFTAEGRFVSDAKKGNYAPRLFAEEQEAKAAGDGLDASGPVLIASRCRFATAGRCTAYRVSKAMNRTIPLRPTISGIRKHLGHFSFYCFGFLLTVEVPTPANEEVDGTRAAAIGPQNSPSDCG